MPLVYACIAPHGGELIPRLAGKKAQLFKNPRKGMRELSRRLGEQTPDTIIVASPHNLRLYKHIGIVLSENCTGSVAEKGDSVSVKAMVDLELGKKLLLMAEEEGLPVVGANYGALEGPASNLPMDWGTLIPLWFLLGSKELARRILVVTPSRGIPLEQNFQFGRLIAKAAESEKKRVAFVASSDQAHAHLKSGPYGFSKEAEEYDLRVGEAIRSQNLKDIMRMDPEFVEKAKPDSLWQMTMLAGLVDFVPMNGEIISYDVPTYFGMICASYRREG